jgi:hypothetical protein
VKTVLQGEWAEKRNKIAKRHNLLVLALLAAIFLLGLSLMSLSHHIPHAVPVAVVLMFIGEAYGIYRIVQYDNEQCRQLGFLCPFCGKPLYENRALIWNTLCPKCGKDIASVQGVNQTPSTSGMSSSRF